MTWKTTVIVSSIAVYLYLLITEWVDLAPWNNVSTPTAAQKLSGTLINAVPFGLLILAFAFGLRWLKLLTIGLFVAWLGVHVAWWWVPYFWGASEAHMEAYNRLFSHTYKVLPPRGDKPIPNAHYMTLQALTLLNLVLAVVALVSGKSQPR